MTVVQEAFSIPDDIVTGLATGLYRRIGSVVRYATGPNKGKIVKHLKPVDLNATEQVQGVGGKALQFVDQHKKETIFTVVSVTAVGIGLFVYSKVKNHEPKVAMEFKSSLRIYINAIRKGDMDIEKINNLLNSLEALKSHKNYAKISIQLTTEDLRILVGRIYDYTVKLASDNQIELTEEGLQNLGNKNTNTITNIQDCLNVQKRIFEEAS